MNDVKTSASNGTTSGQSSSTHAQAAKISDTTMASTTNLNWLLHKMFLIRDFEFCKNLIEQQMKENFNLEYLLLVKGLIFREEGRYHEALKSFQRTIEFDSKNANNYKEIGKTLFMMGRYNQSLEIFLKAESCLKSPDHEVYHYIGDLLCLNAKHSKSNILDAKEYFKRSIMCGKQMETYKTLARIYRKEKDFLKAIELLESCMSVSPGNMELSLELGIMYLKINEVDRAYEKLQEANEKVASEPNVNVLLALGAILQTKNDSEAALNTYKNIRNIQDEGFEVWNNIGMCCYRKNKLIAAISCLKKASWLCPLNFNVLYNLGVVLLTAQQFASAFQCFVTAVSVRPDSAESFMMLAICLYYLSDGENAQIAFRKSILSSSAIKNPLIYLNYSIFALECLKNVDETQQYLNNFYNLCETMKVPSEYIQIAETVLSKLPMQLPETRAINHEIRETKVTTATAESGNDKKEVTGNEAANDVNAGNEIDDDLV